MCHTRSIIEHFLVILLAFLRGKNDTALWELIVWSNKSNALDKPVFDFGARN
jgi:hypothetical protein